MSYDLCREAAAYHFTDDSCYDFFPVLVRFGWKPKHELAYYQARGSQVDSEDALGLAQALEAVLEREPAETDGQDGLQKLADKDFRDKLINFAAFCRGGAFEIR